MMMMFGCLLRIWISNQSHCGASSQCLITDSHGRRLPSLHHIPSILVGIMTFKKASCMESSCSGWICKLQLLSNCVVRHFKWEFCQLIENLLSADICNCSKLRIISRLSSTLYCIEGLRRASRRLARYRIKLSYNSNLTHFHLDQIHKRFYISWAWTQSMISA